jgi:hypothetical protein
MLSLFYMILGAYGFSTAVQILRGNYLNFKPFNCRFCLSYWYSLIYTALLFWGTKNFILNIIFIPFASSGCVYLITVLEEYLLGVRGEDSIR